MKRWGIVIAVIAISAGCEVIWPALRDDFAFGAGLVCGYALWAGPRAQGEQT